MKGFARPIATGRIKGIEKEHEVRDRVIRHEQPGFNLALDCDQLDDNEKASAAQALRKALKELGSG